MADRFRRRPQAWLSGRRQRGFTLVELLVALVLGLLVAGASIAALILGRQGFTSTDASTQLRENGRYAASLIERIAIQAAFQDVADGQFPSNSALPVIPGLQAFDNALVLNPTSLPPSFPAGLVHNSRTSGCVATDTSCRNGSDVLIVRYWGVSRPSGAPNPADNSMINCAGLGEPERASGPSVSVFHVARTTTTGEPTLVCTYQDPTTSAWITVPLVTGVEGFQVLFGTDSVVPNVCATSVAAGPANRYLRASQMDGPTGLFCENNWRRVRTLRVGLLIRGAVGSAPNSTSAGTAAATWTPLAASGANYSFASADDVGTSLLVPADRRMRQQLAFTIHLRNTQ